MRRLKHHHDHGKFLVRSYLILAVPIYDLASVNWSSVLPASRQARFSEGQSRRYYHSASDLPSIILLTILIDEAYYALIHHMHRSHSTSATQIQRPPTTPGNPGPQIDSAQVICMLLPALLLLMTFFTMSSTRSQSSVGTFVGYTPK